MILAHRATRSALPNLDNCKPDDVLDLAANAVVNAADRAELAGSDPHLVAVLRQVGYLDTLQQRQADEIAALKRDIVMLEGQSEAYRHAYLREVECSQHHAAYASQLLDLNERRRKESDMARRTIVEVVARCTVAQSEVHRLESDLLASAYNRASLGVTGMAAADLTAQLNDQIRSNVPPPDEDPWAEPDQTRLFPRGTNPENDAVVIDVDGGR